MIVIMIVLIVNYLSVLTTELHDKSQCIGIIIAIRVRRDRKDIITVLKARKEARGHCKKLLQAVKMQNDAGDIIGERRG